MPPEQNPIQNQPQGNINPTPQPQQAPPVNPQPFSNPQQQPSQSQNTSGQGKNAVVPEEIKGWNWGAFLLTWIWSIGNKVWIGLLILVVSLIPVLWILSIAGAIWLGIKGNELAWKAKYWDSIEHFKVVQRKWSLVAIWIVVAAIVLLIIPIIYFAVGGAQTVRKDQSRKDLASVTIAQLEKYASSHNGKFPSKTDFSGQQFWGTYMKSGLSDPSGKISYPAGIQNDSNVTKDSSCDTPGTLNYTVSSDGKSYTILVCLERTRQWYDVSQPIKE